MPDRGTRAAHLASVALLTPTGRDGAVAQAVLSNAGFAAIVCPDVPALCDAIGAEVGAVIVAEEALRPTARGTLLAALDVQPSWSNVPILVLTGEGELSRTIPPGLQAIADRANVTLLERPVRVATLVTTVRSALHGRRRQFELRDHLEERRVAEQVLRESESRLRDAVLSAPYPMMLYAEGGDVLQLRRAWTALTGYATSDDHVRAADEDEERSCDSRWHEAPCVAGRRGHSSVGRRMRRPTRNRRWRRIRRARRGRARCRPRSGDAASPVAEAQE